MAELGVNTAYLIDKVKPCLTKVTKNINSAKEYAQKYKVPSDFRYNPFLTQVPSKLDNVKVDVKYLNNKIDSVIDQINNIEKKSLNGVNTSAYMAAILLDNNYSFDMPDFSKNEAILSYDEQISDLEAKKKKLEKQIAELEASVNSNEDQKAIKRSHGLYSGNPNISSNTEQLKKLKKEYSKLKSDINSLKQLRKTQLKALEEQFYTSLSYRSDFNLMSAPSGLTPKEAEEIYKLIANAPSGTANINDLFDKKTGQIVSYKKIKEFIDFNRIDLKFYGISEELLKKACSRKCTSFEVALLNTKFQEVAGTEGFRLGEDAGLSDYARAIYYMTPDEVKTYIYLEKSKGKKEADKYFKFKADEINSRQGMIRALKFLSKIDVNDPKAGDYVKTAFKGLGDGTSGFFEGINNFLGGMDETMTPKQYEAMYIISGLSSEDLANLDFLTDDAKKALKGLSANKWLQGTYEISSSIGNMIPSMAASAIVSIAATPAAGQIVGSILMGFSAAGNAAESAYQQGHGYWESMFYGALNGASESVLGYFLGGIPGLSKLDDIPGLKGLVISSLREGGEESIQSIIDPYLKNIALGTDETVDWNEVAKSGLYGMITAGILNSGNMIINGTVVTVDSVMKHGDLISLAASQNITIDVNRIGDATYWNELSMKLKGEPIANVDINTKVDTNTQTKNNIDNKTDIKKESKIKKVKSKVDSAVANAKNTIFTKTAATVVNSVNSAKSKVSNIGVNTNSNVNSNISVNNTVSNVNTNQNMNVKISVENSSNNSFQTNNNVQNNSVNSNIDWNQKAAQVNYYAQKGTQMGINVNSISEIPLSFFDSINDIDSVVFNVNGETITGAQAQVSLKLDGIKSDINTNQSNGIDWDQKASQANISNAKGLFTSVAVDDVMSIPSDFFSKVNNLDNLYFTVNGTQLSAYEVMNQINSNGQANVNNNYDFNEITLDTQNDVEPVRLSSKEEIANYFEDPKLLLLEKASQLYKSGNIDANMQQQLSTLLITPTSDINVIDTLQLLSPYMDQLEISQATLMINNFENTTLGQWQANLTQAEKDAIYSYTKKGGFEINACLNKSEYVIDPKTGNKIDGVQVGNEYVKWTDPNALEKITGLIYSSNGKSLNGKSNNIVNEIDSAISKFRLEEAITVFRGINGFGPDVDMDTISIGQKITTDGYSSCSILNDAATLTKNKNYLLEIDIPPGYNGAYIESISGVKNYGQLEFLLKRKSTIEITDIYINSDGKKVFKCQLIPTDVDLVSVSGNHISADTIITSQISDDAVEIITATLEINNNLVGDGSEVTAEILDINLDEGKIEDAVKIPHIIKDENLKVLKDNGSETTYEIDGVEMPNNNIIVETNIKKSYAFESEKVIDGSVEVYPGTQLSKDRVISNLDDIKQYAGLTLGDKVQTIKDTYGEWSVEGITAEAKIMELAAESSNKRNPFLRSKPSEVSNEVDAIISATDKSKTYLNFKTVSECEQYFQDHLSRMEVMSKAQQGTLENDFYDAMKKYTGAYHIPINSYMRSDGKLITMSDNHIDEVGSAAMIAQESINAIPSLTAGLDTFQLGDNMILYRGIGDIKFFLQEHGIQSTGNIVEDLKLLCGGKFTLSDNAFVSTTPVMGEGFTDSRIVEVIKAPAGSKGAFVGEHSTNSGEVEFLLQAGEMNKGIVECVQEIGNQIFVYIQLVE